ncbi:phosphoenolpyruvate--protein phosphotransferase [Anaeromyxobacter sp. Fw109-5]|uniref:phosphoenolpyruvate--protein phosphotransferase n=1 Tax=Anaeromyxobacter sp. (strain Fw109-5) TaxID=404589 RepID=UPI0000ED8B5B|nr:phosphoenolpyruvate--protein phosphotransferase [Anaeromyxobacter sp. Fw109-5]ABS26230.1 phosphoenolpyruvate-protein phosphotransferase [Anaeromyxobacter sp. Fw109-5]
MLRGTGVSPGVARGTALVIACGYRSAAPRRSIQPSEAEGERLRLDAALAAAAAQLAALQEDVGERLGPSQAEIFGAQTLAVQDPELRERVLRRVREKRINVEAALSEVIDEYLRIIEAVPDTYLRERAADVRDVGRRVLSTLIERRGPSSLVIPAGAIVVTEELLPSVTARLELDRVGGLVTERGHRFSHSSILARSLGTPAIAGVPEASVRIRTGDRLIVDGLAGVVFVNPEPSVEGEYDRLEAELRAGKEELSHLVELPSVTRDGTTVPLYANVSQLADTESALRFEADGIGLYRTEFAFSIHPAFPTEDEQYESLARVAERFHPRRVVFRLLDLGGDKVLPYFPMPPARNPSLAQRGVRLLLRHPDVLKPQLRALLRVSAVHPASILLPVVGGLEEVREIRDVLRQVQAELAAEGRPFNPDVPLGAMIEVPSAALMARTLAREVAFLSLGTNDLVQYVLAADREDESIAPYYQPLHPGVLRLIGSVADAAVSAGRELTICGEMGGDPLHTRLLLGLGLRSFSVAPGEMLAVKSAIRETRLDDARDLAQRAVELGSVAEVEALLGERGAGAPDAS